MKTLLRYLRPKTGIILTEMLIKLSGTVAELLLPWMLSVILDTAVPAGDRAAVFRWGAGMVLCALGAFVGNTIANRISTATSREITRALRDDLFARITRLSGAQTDAFTAPSLISRLTTDTYNVHQMIDRLQRLGVRAPILILGGILLSFRLDPELAMVLVACLPVMALILILITFRGIRLYTRAQRALDGLVRRAQESMAGYRVIRALSRTEYEKQQFGASNAQTESQDSRAGMLMGAAGPAMNLLMNTGLVAVIVIGAYRVNSGVSQPGTVIAFLSYFTIILSAIMTFGRMAVLVSKGTASAGRIEEILTAPDDLPRAERTGAAGESGIVFDHVSFSYDKVRDNLSDISFSLRRGGTLGIIGPTGSGKTTLLLLLLRFYDPDRGSIRIDGRDLRSFPPDLLHAMFGVVFQNDFLAAGSIGDNIRFGREIGEDRVLRALETAQADFISVGGRGLDSPLGEKGSNLSGGQRQRVLLARALAGDPPILLLDDSSSALDYKTDAAFRHALARDAAGSTKLIVAQRVSSIRGADAILVLDDGRAAGFGTHEDLMKSCAEYREIAAAQMGEAV